MRAWTLAAITAVGCVACSRPSGGTDVMEAPNEASCQVDTCPPPAFTGPGLIIGGGVPPSGSDGGVMSDADGGVTSVVGTVVTVNALPPADMTAFRAADGWRVEPVPNSVDLPNTVITADGGAFAIDDVPVVGATFVLRATSPLAATELAALRESTPTVSSLSIVAVTNDVLTTAAISAGVSVQPTAAHLVVQFVDPAANVAGVSLDFEDGTAANIAYDNGVGVLAPSLLTQTRGMAVAFNIRVPATGRVHPRVIRGSHIVVYDVAVASGAVTWLAIPPP